MCRFCAQEVFCCNVLHQKGMSMVQHMKKNSSSKWQWEVYIYVGEYKYATKHEVWVES